MELKKIAEGWYNWIRAPAAMKDIIETRLAICDPCPHKMQLSPIGVTLLTTINSESSTFKCGVCKCPLSALTASPNSACRIGRWKAVGKK